MEGQRQQEQEIKFLRIQEWGNTENWKDELVCSPALTGIPVVITGLINPNPHFSAILRELWGRGCPRNSAALREPFNAPNSAALWGQFGISRSWIWRVQRAPVGNVPHGFVLGTWREKQLQFVFPAQLIFLPAALPQQMLSLGSQGPRKRQPAG